MDPCTGVNLEAFLRRFQKTCCRRFESPRTFVSAASSATTSSCSFDSKSGREISTARRMTSCRFSSSRHETRGARSRNSALDRPTHGTPVLGLSCQGNPASGAAATRIPGLDGFSSLKLPEDGACSEIPVLILRALIARCCFVWNASLCWSCFRWFIPDGSFGHRSMCHCLRPSAMSETPFGNTRGRHWHPKYVRVCLGPTQ